MLVGKQQVFGFGYSQDVGDGGSFLKQKYGKILILNMTASVDISIDSSAVKLQDTNEHGWMMGDVVRISLIGSVLNAIK